MKRTFTIIAAFLTATFCWGQNLVPNPSFETVITPPCSWLTAPNQLPAAVSNWTMPSNGSTDIFTNYVATTCYAHNFSTNSSSPGTQAPHTGNAQSALVMYGTGCGSNYREYLQVQLTSPLVVGQLYDLGFWVSMADYSYLATNRFSMYFATSSTFVATCDNITVTPQFTHSGIITDKVGWVHITGTVTATAAWNYIIVGNFSNNAATTTQNVGGSLLNARYFIDDISVAHVILAAAPDLQLNAQRATDGTVQLDWNALDELPIDGYVLQRSRYGDHWETVTEPRPNDLAYADRFAPNTPLKYRLRYVDLAGVERTSATIDVEKSIGLPYGLHLSNNPARVGEDCVIRISNADDALATIAVHDISGREVWSADEKPLLEWDKFTLPTAAWQPGIYIISMQVGGGVLNTKLVLGQ